MRRPLSPISPSKSSKTSVDDLSTSNGETMQKELPFTTPSKANIVADDENKTLKAVPMQTVMTSAPAPIPYGLWG